MRDGDGPPPAHIAVCGGSKVLAQLLWNRGVRSLEEVKKCMGPNHYIGTPPDSMLYNPERAEELKSDPRDPEVSLGLRDIDDTLLRGLYRLASTGVEAIDPVFVCPAVHLVNARANGLASRHARLLIEDEHGEQLSANWWHMPPSLVPKGLGDAVFSLRVDDRFGRLEIRAELLAFNGNRAEDSEKDTDLTAAAESLFAVEDWRRVGDVLDKVLDLQDVQVWAEGSVEELPMGHRRDELVKGRSLVLWTRPPSPDVLRAVLEHVQPEELWVCALPMPDLEIGDFLRELGGLTKAVIAHRCGRIARVELAARLGQTEAIVLAGLEVLESMGLLRYRAIEERVLFEQGDGKRSKNTRGQTLGNMLREVAAYRRYIGEAAIEEWLL